MNRRLESCEMPLVPTDIQGELSTVIYCTRAQSKLLMLVLGTEDLIDVSDEGGYVLKR